MEGLGRLARPRDSTHLIVYFELAGRPARKSLSNCEGSELKVAATTAKRWLSESVTYLGGCISGWSGELTNHSGSEYNRRSDVRS